MRDGKNVPFTTQEETARDAEEQTWADEQAELAKTKYQRDRQAEYPKIEELVVALYDTADKAAIEKRRSDVKAKYPIATGNKAKWNGTAMEEWVAVMIDSDRALPRWAEDMYDTLPQLSKDGAAAALSSKVAQKKLLRQSKPYKL